MALRVNPHSESTGAAENSYVVADVDTRADTHHLMVLSATDALAM